jgi:hypothetical protein
MRGSVSNLALVLDVIRKVENAKLKGYAAAD